MPGGFSVYEGNVILNSVFDSGAALWIAWSTTAPNADGTNVTEPVGNNYSRTAITAGDWATSSARATSNASAVTSATASGSWGTISHFALYDAASAGNMIDYGTLDVSKAIGNGQSLRFAAGALDVTLT